MASFFYSVNISFFTFLDLQICTKAIGVNGGEVLKLLVKFPSILIIPELH